MSGPWTDMQAGRLTALYVLGHDWPAVLLLSCTRPGRPIRKAFPGSVRAPAGRVWRRWCGWVGLPSACARRWLPLTLR